MGVVPYLCLLLSCLAGVRSDIVLIQPKSAVVQPGQSHTLTCEVKGFDISSYYMHWVKQVPGKGLEWLVVHYSESYKYYAPGVQSRFTASKGSSNLYLQMNSLRLNDTATYYCARDYGAGRIYVDLDYWGGGTSLTVTSEVKSVPSVYITLSCNRKSDQGNRILCLVKDYQPESVSQTWSTNNGDITTGIKKYPAVLGQNSKYTMSSLLEVSAADWKNKVYYCKAGYKPNEIETAEWQKPQPQSPKLSSLVPSREMIRSQANAVLGCVISGFSPDNVTVSWKKAGSAQEGIVLPSTRRSGGGFETIAYLTVPVQEWTKKQEYTCEVNHAPSGVNSQVNMMYQEDDCSDAHSSVTLSKPSFEEIWTKRTATILCEVVHSDLLGFSVTWQVDGRKREDGVRTDSKGGEDTITSRLTVPAAEWNSGAEFSCVIEDKSLPTPVKKSIRKDTGDFVTRPQVYLLPPSSDEIDTDQTGTLMCLVTKFSPADIYVVWMANDTLLKTVFVNQPVTKDPRKGWNTMTSQLKVSPEEWKSGTTFSCVVGHESLTTNLFRSINKSHSKPTLVNVSLVLTDSFKSCV